MNIIALFVLCGFGSIVVYFIVDRICHVIETSKTLKAFNKYCECFKNSNAIENFYKDFGKLTDFGKPMSNRREDTNNEEKNGETL